MTLLTRHLVKIKHLAIATFMKKEILERLNNEYVVYVHLQVWTIVGNPEKILYEPSFILFLN